METTTEQDTSKRNHKSGAKELDLLKKEFAKLGDLSRKLKNVNSGAQKSDIRNKHAYELNGIKKAIKIFKLEVLKNEDLKTYRALLTWERQRNLINVVDEYALNKMEADTLEEGCECFNPPPSGLRCSIGGKYKFVSYFDEARQKEMYVTYIPVTIAPESQISQQLEWKMAQGFMPSMEDYPEAKILWKRRVLVDSEWQRYFREI